VHSHTASKRCQIWCSQAHFRPQGAFESGGARLAAGMIAAAAGFLSGMPFVQWRRVLSGSKVGVEVSMEVWDSDQGMVTCGQVFAAPAPRQAATGLHGTQFLLLMPTLAPHACGHTWGTQTQQHKRMCSCRCTGVHAGRCMHAGGSWGRVDTVFQCVLTSAILPLCQGAFNGVMQSSSPKGEWTAALAAGYSHIHAAWLSLNHLLPVVRPGPAPIWSAGVWF